MENESDPDRHRCISSTALLCFHHGSNRLYAGSPVPLPERKRGTQVPLACFRFLYRLIPGTLLISMVVLFAIGETRLDPFTGMLFLMEVMTISFWMKIALA